jgi:hypothetical protein
MSTSVPLLVPASFNVPEFGRSADGLAVARIGDTAATFGPKQELRRMAVIWGPPKRCAAAPDQWRAASSTRSGASSP